MGIQGKKMYFFMVAALILAKIKRQKNSHS